MKVVEYLKAHGVEKLAEEFSIIVKAVDDLYVLNYNQIESPKAHPIVMECRSLILDTSFNVVSRSFDRFFNLGEAPDTQTHLDMNLAVCYEKVDGSLIKLYFHNGKWHVATRGTAYADSQCNWGPTFKELVMRALNVKDDAEMQIRLSGLNTSETHIFELTSQENRVVRRYEGYSLHYLRSRVNATGEYINVWPMLYAICKLGSNIVQPRFYKFSDVSSCLAAAKSLPNLEEGYVIYQEGLPVCKVKSPAYLAVHAIRGEGLTPKRTMQLVLMNEQDEYLTYFPEDSIHFTPVVAALKLHLQNITDVYEQFSNVESQKEFALAVSRYKFASILFKARLTNVNPVHVFHEANESLKLKLLSAML